MKQSTRRISPYSHAGFPNTTRKSATRIHLTIVFVHPDRGCNCLLGCFLILSIVAQERCFDDMTIGLIQAGTANCATTVGSPFVVRDASTDPAADALFLNAGICPQGEALQVLARRRQSQADKITDHEGRRDAGGREDISIDRSESPKTEHRGRADQSAR